jgi:hypothetical protein
MQERRRYLPGGGDVRSRRRIGASSHRRTAASGLDNVARKK